MKQDTYAEKVSSISKQKRQKWEKQQKYIRDLISQVDDLPDFLEKVNLVAAVDISFSGKFQNGACAGLIIYDISLRKIVYEDFEYVVLKEDYLPGFLAFRQLGPSLQLFRKLKTNKPNLWPHVIVVDGNGILHKRYCGYASHLGVLLKTPAFGCAKTFFDVDGLHQHEIEDYLSNKLQNHGEFEIIKGKSGKQWCTGILADQNQNKHIYVSVGTKISLDTATKITLKLLKYQSPQPIRLVDRISRKWIRKMTQQDYKKAKSYEMVYLDA